jgi:hypothetical protein
MTKCIKEKLTLPFCQGRIIEAEFVKEAVTSDGGVLLLREIDRKLNLISELEKIIPDPREPTKIKHSLISMLRQRIYGIALGYEDLNDHITLRNDPAIQTAVERINALASSPTPYAGWKIEQIEKWYLLQIN